MTCSDSFSVVLRQRSTAQLIIGSVADDHIKVRKVIDMDRMLGTRVRVFYTALETILEISREGERDFPLISVHSSDMILTRKSCFSAARQEVQGVNTQPTKSSRINPDITITRCIFRVQSSCILLNQAIKRHECGTKPHRMIHITEIETKTLPPLHPVEGQGRSCR